VSYHQNVWLMSQIEALAAMLAYLVTGKKRGGEEESQQLKETNLLYRRLCLLVEKGEFGRAEDLLFAAMDEEDPEVPEAAAQFYRDLNEYSDAQLEERSFTREEIMEGLQEICRNYQLQIF